MHMARLLDSSREPQEYSLHKISKFYQKEYNNYYKKMLEFVSKSNTLSDEEKQALEIYKSTVETHDVKVSMNKLFARKKLLKNGAEGKIFEV